MTQRGEQITTIGLHMGKFMEGDVIEQALAAMLHPGSSLANYREDIGNRVQRYIKVLGFDEEEGTVEIEVRFTGWREPEKRWRVRVIVEEMEA